MTRKSTLTFAFLLTGILLSASAARTRVAQQPVQQADLVLTNARIVTVDDTVPEAQAIAARGDPRRTCDPATSTEPASSGWAP